LSAIKTTWALWEFPTSIAWSCTIVRRSDFTLRRGCGGP